MTPSLLAIANPDAFAVVWRVRDARDVAAGLPPRAPRGRPSGARDPCRSGRHPRPHLQRERRPRSRRGAWPPRRVGHARTWRLSSNRSTSHPPSAPGTSSPRSTRRTPPAPVGRRSAAASTIASSTTASASSPRAAASAMAVVLERVSGAHPGGGHAGWRRRQRGRDRSAHRGPARLRGRRHRGRLAAGSDPLRGPRGLLRLTQSMTRLLICARCQQRGARRRLRAHRAPARVPDLLSRLRLGAPADAVKELDLGRDPEIIVLSEAFTHVAGTARGRAPFPSASPSAPFRGRGPCLARRQPVRSGLVRPRLPPPRPLPG